MTIAKFTTWTFVLLLIISLLLVVHLLKGFIAPVILALVIVSIFGPVYRRLLAWCGERHYLAASLATAAVCLGVLIPITLFMISLVQQILVLYQASQELNHGNGFREWLSTLTRHLEGLRSYVAELGINISPQKIVNFGLRVLQSIGNTVYNSVGLVAANVIAIVFNFVLMVALVFVFFASGRTAKTFVMDLVPIPHDEKERLIKRFKEISSAVFLGNGLISALEGLIGGLTLYAFGVSGALIWGVIMAIAAFLPLVGASVVIVPATIYLLLIDDIWQAIVFVSINTVQVAILESYVKPRLIGTKSQMHGLLVFLSLIAGVQVYGVLGLFLGPLLVTMFLSLAEIYKDHYRAYLLKD